MSGSSWLNAPARVLDAALLVLVAFIGAIVYPPSLPFIAPAVAIVVLLFAIRHLLSLPRKLGIVGWLALVTALWLSLAGLWGNGGVGSPAVWLMVFAFLGIPAVCMADLSGLKKVANDVVVIVALVLGGLVIFETASDGFLADTVFGPSFLAVYSAGAILVWPMAALIRVHYGWKEALLWTVVIAVAVILGAAPGVAYGVTAGLIFFGLGLLSLLLAKFSLVLLIVVCAMVPPVLAFAGVEIPGLASLGTAEAWGTLIEQWSAAPAQGVGPGVSVAGVSSVYGTLLLGTGAVGFLLICLTLGYAAISAVKADDEGWAGASSAGLIAAVVVAGLSGLGPFSEWWMAFLVVASVALAICRAPEAAGASLGSIFGTGADTSEEEEPFDRLDDEADDDLLDEDDYEDDDEEYDDFDDEDDELAGHDEDDDGFDEEDMDDEDDEPPEEWNFDPSQFGQDDGKNGR